MTVQEAIDELNKVEDKSKPCAILDISKYGEDKPNTLDCITQPDQGAYAGFVMFF